MLQHLKENYFNICLTLVYTILASLVYGIWSYSSWHLWYVTFIIVFVIFVIGAVIGYFWIRSEIRKKEVKKEPAPEETIVQ
ncbi:hypothetical protein HDR67_01930 [bacterium]|nr:hypothetical protein [bacterium]